MPLSLYQERNQKSPLSDVKTILAVAAGKGGVGKSTIAVNLGLALKSLGYQVGIMDTDIYGPSIRQMLPEDRLPSQKGSMIQPALCQGIKMISMAYFRKSHEAAAVRAPIANGLISQFIQNVEWGSLDFLLVDFPPGTGDIQLTLSQKSHLSGAIMVTTPQEVALLDVRKAMSLFDQVKVPILGIIENMSYYQSSDQAEPVYLFGRGGGERLGRETGFPLLGQVPLDPLIVTCGDQGKSLFIQDPQAQKPVTQAFLKIASQVVLHVSSLKKVRQDGIGAFELIWKEM